LFAAINVAFALKKWGYFFHKMSTALINFNKFSFGRHCNLFTLFSWMVFCVRVCLASQLLKVIRKSN
jgi:hypothetical protein